MSPQLAKQINPLAYLLKVSFPAPKNAALNAFDSVFLVINTLQVYHKFYKMGLLEK